MATTPAVQFPTPTIEQVSALPTTAIPDNQAAFDPVIPGVNGKLELRPKYQHLKAGLRDRLIQLTRDWGVVGKLLSRHVGNCMMHGFVYKKCKDKNFGRGARIRCHDPVLCDNCGTGRLQARAWLTHRDEQRIISKPLVGMELTFTADSGHNWLCARGWVVGKAKKLVAKLGYNSLTHDAAPDITILEQKGGTIRLRIVLQANGLNQHKVEALWQSVTGCLHATCTLYRGDGASGEDARKVLNWAFAGLEPVLLWQDNEARIKLRLMMQDVRITRTSGRHFRALTKDEMKARNDAKESHLASEKDLCPCESCKLSSEPLIYIPPDERRIHFAEDVEAEFKVISWDSNFLRYINCDVLIPIESETGNRDNPEAARASP